VVKVRIHELAKDLKMENKDLIKLLEKMGLPVKSVQSTLDDSDVERVKNHISLSKREGVVEQRVKPTVIRRRVMKEEPAPVPPPAPPKEEVKPDVEAKPPVAKKGEVRPPVVKKEGRPEAAKLVAEAPVEVPKKKAELKAEVPPAGAEEVKAAPEPAAIPGSPAAPRAGRDWSPTPAPGRSESRRRGCGSPAGPSWCPRGRSGGSWPDPGLSPRGRSR